MLSLIDFLPCGSEEVVAFLLGKQVADLADGLPQIVAGAGGGSADQGLELGERYFDRVWVEAVWEKKEEPRADGLHGLGRVGAFVRRQIVENDHVAGQQDRGQPGLDIKLGSWPHRLPGAVQPIMAQRRDEGPGLAMAEGDMVDQTCALEGPSRSPDHVRLQRGFINETDVGNRLRMKS